MNCKAASRLLDAYLDGALEPTVLSGVRSHVERCEDCAYELKALRALREALNDVSTPAPDVHFEDRLVRNVFRAVEKREKKETNLWWAAACGATFLVVSGVMSAVAHREAQFRAAENNDGMLEMQRDQAYVSQSDPLSGPAVVVPANYRQ